MSEADTLILGTVLVLGVLVGLMSWYAIGLAKRTEAANAALDVQALRGQVQAQLGRVRFVWAVWQGRLSFGGGQMRVYDEQGGLITEILFHALPQAGVLQAFRLDGRAYECVNEGLLSGRSWLRDTQTGEVELSCQHGALRQVFFAGKSDRVVFELGYGSVFKNHAPLVGGAIVDGRLQTLQLGDASVIVLSADSDALSRLEQCFLFLSLPKRS